MRDDVLIEILSKYGVHEPKITFIRHNENRTYKVEDPNSGAAYLFRIHQSLKENMVDLQHTYSGILSELEMLQDMADQTNLIVQTPIRNCDGEYITKLQYRDKEVCCSLLTWIEGEILNKDDVSDDILVRKIGAKIAELHRFFQSYHRVKPETRPHYDTESNIVMLHKIHRGVELVLFPPSDYAIVEKTMHAINAQLEALGRSEEQWGIIHADLAKNNILLTPTGDISFIDYGFFGYGYYAMDVAMGASMVPADKRDALLEGYYGQRQLSDADLTVVEGLILVSIFGYYAFQMENEDVHPWMRERMPQLCAKRCMPFLLGERIFYQF
ncbi:phosphotransferase enzyme family protein [Paenibacillus marinisediminis]